MKGFTKDGKFRPITDHKGVRKSRDVSAKEQGVRLKKDGSRIKTLKFKVWKYEDAPPDLQEKIIEKLRERQYEFGDEFFADYDGIIYDKKTNIADYDVFEKYSKKYYDLDRGQYIQFPDLEIKDEKKLAKMLGIPESLGKKIDFRFNSERENNTKIEFVDYEWNGEIDVDESYSNYKEPLYGEEHYSGDTKPLTEKEFNILVDASEKWNDLMHNAWVSLRDSYEYQFSDEYLKQEAIAQEHEFDEDADIA